jgi:hypothetical protein
MRRTCRSQMIQIKFLKSDRHYPQSCYWLMSRSQKVDLLVESWIPISGSFWILLCLDRNRDRALHCSLDNPGRNWRITLCQFWVLQKHPIRRERINVKSLNNNSPLGRSTDNSGPEEVSQSSCQVRPGSLVNLVNVRPILPELCSLR